MDVNALYECIGYGTTRAVMSSDFETAPSKVPARYILETARDPVAYCIEAYANRRPDCVPQIDAAGRALILTHLEREAGILRH